MSIPLHADELGRLGLPFSEEEIKAIEASQSLLNFTRYTKNDYEVNWHHDHLCDKLDKFVKGEIKRLMVFMPPRTGKKIADSVPVITDRGWIAHGDLQVGDYVYHPNGHKVKVLAVNEKSPIGMEVSFTNGEAIKCHEEHEWTVYDRSCGKWRTVETSFFKERTKFGNERKLVTGDRNRCTYQLPFRSALDLPEKDLLIHPYFLGLWLGDGTSIEPRITCDPRDVDFTIKKVQEVCGYSISKTWKHSETGVLTVSFAGQDLRSKLKTLGVFDDKHIPDVYLHSSIEQRKELLSGLIDSDGGVDDNSKVYIANTNPLIIDGVRELALSLGFNPYIVEEQPKLSSSGVQGKQVVYRVCFQSDIDLPVALVRKQIKRKDYCKRRIGVASVRYLEESETELGQCIQVDSSDGLYLVGKSLIPTHNSELVSRRLPPYIFGHNPDASIIACSYSADLSSRMNRDVQRVISSPEYKRVFPETTLWEKNIRTVADGSYLRNSEIFEVVNRKGVYRCAGVGGGITGMGGNFLIIDDVIKNSEEAESPIYREKIWEWYTTTFYTRAEKDAGILITLTRWHDDDLAGRLLKLAEKDPNADQWDVISFPMVKETHKDPQDPREIGEPLWPNKFSPEKVVKIKATLGSRNFQALHQQSPTSEKGNLVKREWWKFYKALPQNFDLMTTTWDCTFKDDKTSDFVVGQAWGKLVNDFYLIDQVRDQMGFTATCKAMIAFCAKHKRAMEHIVEEKANGAAIIDTLSSKVIGIVPYKPTESKYARANSVVPMIESGHVLLPDPDYFDAPWVNDYIEEWASFPKGKHDDQVDATVQYLIRMQSNAYAWLEGLTTEHENHPIGKGLAQMLGWELDNE